VKAAYTRQQTTAYTPTP